LSLVLCCCYYFFCLFISIFFFLFFFLMIRRPPRSTLFPTRRSSDLGMVTACTPPASIDHNGSVMESTHSGVGANPLPRSQQWIGDRKSTRLNSSHVSISYAVFCLKKKKNRQIYIHN